MSEEPQPTQKIKTRQGSGYLKQLYSTARTTAETTHSHLKNLTTFLVNFIPIEKIDPSPTQVRTHFDEEEIAALAQSVQQHGVLQPILVIQSTDRYQVIAGERRLRAAKLAGLNRIPARVLSTNDQATQEIALRENLDRVDLHPIEEGEGYQILLQTQAYATHDEISKAFGKPKSRITECIGFARFPKNTKEELLRTGIKSRSLLRSLLTLPGEEQVPLIHTYMQSQLAAETSETKSQKKKPTSSKKKYSFHITQQKIMIPRFQWKATEEPALLKNYLKSLKDAILEIEALIKA